MQKSQQEDYKRYFVEDGDAGFNPARNKAIIEKTIKDYETYRKNKLKQRNEQIAERANVVANYLKSNAVDSGRPIDKYISKRYLAKLRGEEFLEELRQNLRILHGTQPQED